MAQRAQRAKWMKTDPNPDFEIPMMVDFINDPPNKNNAIRRAYLGGGFYSGFVIDCDGKVLYSKSWAWFAPGKDWWNLPLDPISNLHGLLDKYLQNPPSCYGKGGSVDSGAATLDIGSSSPDHGMSADSGAGSPDQSTTKVTPPAKGGDDGCSVIRTDQEAPIPLLLLGAVLAGRLRFGRARG